MVEIKGHSGKRFKRYLHRNAKTYLSLWFSTEGTRTSEVNGRLMSMGFRAAHGKHDYIYDWSECATVDDALRLGDQVHVTLKDCNVQYKLETF